MTCSWLQNTLTSLHPKRWENYTNCRIETSSLTVIATWSDTLRGFFVNTLEQNPLGRDLTRGCCT